MKSEIYPYVPERVGGMWVMRDRPLRKRERKIEVVSQGLSPAETVRLIGEAGLGWHFVVTVHPSGEELAASRSAFKALGYRALSTEWIFEHDMVSIPVFESALPVRLVETAAQLEDVKQVASQPRKLMANTRLFGIWDSERDYGWVRGVPQDGAFWAYDLYVYEAFRRQGFGRALMSRFLQEARSQGFESSALIASTAGARLYPHLGFREIGTLQVLCPVERGGD